MKNYISVNAKYYTSERISRIARHNYRLSNIDYLLEKGEELGKNIDIIYSRSSTQIDLNLNPLDKATIFKKEFEQQEADKRAMQIKKGYHPPKGAKNKDNSIVEMVVALSEEQAKEYINSGVDISVGFDKFAQNIKAVYGFEPLSVSLHLDEGYKDTNGDIKYNIHAHITLHNFDFKTGNTILRKLKKSAFSDMQDLAEKSFQEVGLNFSRGQSKEVTNKKHLERNAYISQQQTLHIQELANAIDIKQDRLKDTNGNMFILEKSIKQLQVQKDTLMSEYEELTAKLLNAKDKVQKIDIEVENTTKWKEELKKDIKKYLSKNTYKTDDNKYQIKNINTMYSDLIGLAEDFSNVELKIQQIDELNQENINLKSKINIYQNDIDTLKKENALIESKLQIELNKKYKLEDTNYAFNSFINDENLSDKFKSYIDSTITHNVEDIGK
ncbi:coiled-coil domain-containing protein [Arcobacter sp. FWKO B]|uniref:coiled-coil domain-containing protein n=1 Tax=Arcobacter sp. FWKO B TaxID=2593672 RepID=UPI0018A3C4E4|nr:hypothetical protein [Arcobacter sp. FWKO B]QOG11427.1 hypothetical protein FWKOB_01390 [Arcobacter sp. FWKO B]